MISLIKFDHELVVPREVAVDLGLRYKELAGERIGYYDDNLRVLGSDSYAILGEDCFNQHDKPGYYVRKDGKEISSYYVYKPISVREKSIDFVKIPHTTHMVDLYKFATQCPYKFTIEKSIAPKDTPVTDINYLLDAVEHKLSFLDTAIDKATSFNFNSKCNVHVGGGLIVTYNEVMLLEDSCSDTLQEELNNGWRMIAVCVQPDQRRPDYILGRYNENISVESSTRAKRKPD